MTISIKSSTSKSGSPVGAAKFFPIAESTFTNPLITIDDRVFLRSGVMLQNESANYPEAYAVCGAPGRVWNAAASVPPAITATPQVGAYGNGVFVIAQSTTGIVRTVDGVNFASSTVATSVSIVTFGKGLFVATSSGLSNAFYTSPDGINWTSRTFSASFTISNLTFGGGLFVITETTNSWTSTDGINWTKTTGAFATAPGSRTLVYGGGLFTVAYTYGSYFSSTDGVTWTARTFPAIASQYYLRMYYANNIWVGITTSLYTADPAYLWTSTDGITWSFKTSSAFNSYNPLNTCLYSGGLYYLYNYRSLGMWVTKDFVTYVNKPVNLGASTPLVIQGDNLILGFNTSTPVISPALIGFPSQTISGPAVKYMRIK